MISYVERLIVEHRILIVDELDIDRTFFVVALHYYICQKQIIVTENYWATGIGQQRFQIPDFGFQTFDPANKGLLEPT